MGNYYSFVEDPLPDYGITVRFPKALCIIVSSKEPTYKVTTVQHNGTTVLCVHTDSKFDEQNPNFKYKLCKALIYNFGTDSIQSITIENGNEYNINYDNGETETYTKHINVGGCCHSDRNCYFIKCKSNRTLLKRRVAYSDSSSDSSDYR